MTRDERIALIVEKTEEACGAALIEQFPDARTGDVDPVVAMDFQAMITRVANDWIRWNAPARFTDQPFEEHRGIVFPGWLQAWAFEDHSYRNDSCARACKPLADGVNDLICWVNYSDGPEHGERLYRVELVVHEQTEPVAELYEGDDVELVKAAIRGVVQPAGTDARV